MHGSHPTQLIACDALNARTVTIREYHYARYTSSPTEFLPLFHNVIFLARYLSPIHSSFEFLMHPFVVKGEPFQIAKMLMQLIRHGVSIALALCSGNVIRSTAILQRRYLACFLCQRTVMILEINSRWEGDEASA